MILHQTYSLHYPLLLLFVTVTTLDWVMESLSLLVFTAELVTDKVCWMVGLLLFTMEIDMLVLGDPMLEMLVSIPPCWETIQAMAAPKPVK